MFEELSRVICALPDIDQEWLQTALRRGLFSITETPVTDCSEAMKIFTAFGGQGWLCTAEDKTILSFYPDKPLPPGVNSAWPLWGEAADGEKSLHLRRYETGWRITELEKQAAGDGILLRKQLLARSGPPLVYEVAYSLEEKCGLDELRPTACRFCGFDRQSGETP